MHGDLTASINGESEALSYIPRLFGYWQEKCYDICSTALTGQLSIEFTARNVEAGIDDVRLSEYMCNTGKNGKTKMYEENVLT